MAALELLGRERIMMGQNRNISYILFSSLSDLLSVDTLLALLLDNFPKFVISMKFLLKRSIKELFRIICLVSGTRETVVGSSHGLYDLHDLMNFLGSIVITLNTSDEEESAGSFCY